MGNIEWIDVDLDYFPGYQNLYDFILKARNKSVPLGVIYKLRSENLIRNYININGNGKEWKINEKYGIDAAKTIFILKVTTNG